MKPSADKGCVVTVGTFDGMHLGHQAVVRKVVEEAGSREMIPLVITFDPHPLAVVAPDRAPGMLESVEERVECIRCLGAEPVVVRFDKDVMDTSADEWLEILKHRYGAEILMAGYDNKFGCDGQRMNIEDYMELGSRHGIRVMEAPVVDGISSSKIREALRLGDVALAGKMLGRLYSVEGKVVHGKELGRRLGFPTANISVDNGGMLPAAGVYVADVKLEHGNLCRAVVNVGNAPTVAPGLPLTVEAYIIGFEGDLYDKSLRVYFLERLRDERRFESIEMLKSQIAADAEYAAGIYAT